MAAQRWLKAVVLTAPAVLAAPVKAMAAESCVRQVRVEQPFPGAVRIVVEDPCRADRPVTFRHNGREVVRFADAQGRVELLRVLDPDRPDLIELVEDGHGRRVFAERKAEGDGEETAAVPPAAPRSVAAPSGRPPGGGSAGGTEPAEEAGFPPGGAGARPPSPTPTREGPPAAMGAPRTAGGGMRPRERGVPPAGRSREERPAATHRTACAATVRVEEHGGLARIRISAPCPPRTPVTVEVTPRGWTFVRSLDEAGRAEVVLPVLDRAGTIRVRVDGGPATERRLPSAPARLLRVVLEWEGGTDLDLHVLEPGGRLAGEVRHVHPGNPDGGGRGLGRLERKDDGTRSGTKIESYVVDRRSARGVVLRLYVVDAARGRRPVPPHCSGGELAGPAFRILVAGGGEVRARAYRIPPVSCGTRLSDRRYYVQAGRVRVR